MYNNKKILAIIPARSGSKGLKDKNIKVLNGKPMIAYTIEAAKKSLIFEDIIVSTDSQEYAELCTKYGAKVPFIRPEYLSTDIASTNDVIEHTIKELKVLGFEYDYFMVLQPTSPLRESEDILGAMRLLVKNNANSIVSVCKAEHPPVYMNTIDESLCIDGFLAEDIKTRRQDVPSYYRLNGAIYLSKVGYYLEYKNFYKEKSFAYIMNKRNSVDVDDEIDFMMAESLLQYAGKRSVRIEKE